MNKVILVGRLAKDVDKRYTTTQKARASFAIAVDNGKDRPADFINCIAWEKTADTIEKYFHKGKGIIVEGAIKTDSYEKNGQKKSFTYVNVYSFEFVPETRSQNNEMESIADARDYGFEQADDDIPF